MSKRFFCFYLLFITSLQFGFSQGSGNDLTFNGSNQYIDLGTTVAANCRTIEFWFKPNVLIDNNMPDVVSFIIRDFNNGDGLNTNEFGFYIPAGNWPSNQGYMTFYRRIGTTSYSIISNSNNWQAGVWYHVAGVIDPVSGMQLYINGVLQNNTDPSTQPIQPQTGAATDMVAISTWGYAGEYYGIRFYDGDMDEVRFWTTARTQAQIRDNMCRKINPSQTGLQAYYNFDVSTGSSLTDITGNGFNGILNNLPTNSWHYSSAPIGDTATNVYPASWAAQTLTLQNAPGDNFSISNVTANPDGAHIYRVASLPNVTGGLTNPLPDYYGVFLTSTLGNYDIAEDFSSFTSSCTSSCLTLAARSNNAVLSWTGINPTVNNCALTKANESSVGVPYRAEYILSVGSTGLTVTSTSVNCHGGNDGSATAIASGGATPYIYTWSPSGSNSPTINVGAGTYSVTVSDASGCRQTSTITIIEPTPISVTTNSITACIGRTDTLIADAFGGVAPYNYTWNGIYPGKTYTLSPTSNGIYTVTVTDANGCLAPPATAAVVLLPPLQVVVGDATICSGNNTSLTAFASGGNNHYLYNWMPGNLSGSTISMSPQTTTIYTVTVSDGCTLNNASDTGVVLISSSIPTLTLQSAVLSCAPVCVSFNPQYTGTAITTWTWNFGDNTTSSQEIKTHCYNTSGSYTVSLTYGTSYGCSKTITGNNLVTVFNSPQANFTDNGEDVDILNPTIQFENETQSAISYQWFFGDSQFASTQNPSHTYSSVGDYSVTLIATNAMGCTDTVTHEVSVKEAFTFFAPNCFTPNADNLNEQFLPTGTGWNTTTFNMQVFDRWGNNIFNSHDYAKGWDGKISEKRDVVLQDIFVWKVSLNDNMGKQHQYNGIVSIIK